MTAMSEANLDLSSIPDDMDELEIQLERNVRLLKAKNKRRTLEKHHSRSDDLHFSYDGSGKRLKKDTRCRSVKRSRSTAVG